MMLKQANRKRIVYYHALVVTWYELIINMQM